MVGSGKGGKEKKTYQTYTVAKTDDIFLTTIHQVRDWLYSSLLATACFVPQVPGCSGT